ncbi:phosphatases II [Coprinopsis marcescibilis]|uniref:protein-tyrosine-phosphatase n=1 Tax=Coprinopsis marcescibilis TaxID=230819 RepID=A0A5C3KZX9_COPMA|nr:phosphatases II [Coprinopsis marcescibilis]
MVSFPTQNWKTALTKVSRKASGMVETTQGASEINPRLYLSGYWPATNEEELRRLGITHVISAIEHRPAIPQSIPQENRLQIFIADRPDANILDHLEESTKFIKNALAESETNKVLVHCFQGISRSATVVSAYLIATEGMEAHKSIARVQSLRNVVCPNLGFRLQLLQYSERFPKRDRSDGKPMTFRRTISQRFRKLMSPTVPGNSGSPPPLPVTPIIS